MYMVQVSLLHIYLLSYILNPLLALFFKYFLQNNSVLIIIDLVLEGLVLECLVLVLEGQVLVNITDSRSSIVNDTARFPVSVVVPIALISFIQ